jgi:hypothetical protein
MTSTISIGAALYLQAATGGGASGRGCGRAPGTLPASVGREDLVEAGQIVVIRRLLLVVHHEQALGAGPDRFRDCPDRAATTSFETVCSGPERFASCAKTPAALPRAPGSADGSGRALPVPTSSRQ